MEKPVTLYVRRREGRTVRWDRATHDDILVQPIVARLRADLAARDADLATVTRERDVALAEWKRSLTMLDKATAERDRLRRENSALVGRLQQYGECLE